MSQIYNSVTVGNFVKALFYLKIIKMHIGKVIETQNKSNDFFEKCKLYSKWIIFLFTQQSAIA